MSDGLGSGGGAQGDLAERFRRLIRTTGPLPVSRYMGESNAHYYATRDPLGLDSGDSGGDFTTAPEISQMFGELIGLWLTDYWARAGSARDAAYVELGPGRGTLAQDALRAMASQGLRPAVHLLEGSPALRAKQAQALPQAQFHDTLDTLPDDAPLLVVANEFFDALPVRQLVRTDGGWRERMVALDGEEFVFAAGPSPIDDAVPETMRDAPAGTVIETCPAAAALLGELARRIALQGGAALIVDYGHLSPRTGSTLQAVKAHEKIGVFDAPGAMDLTAHVDFAQAADIASRAGLATASATQGAWLAAMGIDMRAAALSARHPDRADAIAAARDRLVGLDAMGELFKVLAIMPRDGPRGAGFG